MAIAALERARHHAGHQGLLPGRRHFYGRSFQCWKKGGHGTVDLRHAIEQSCNVFFYTVGDQLEDRYASTSTPPCSAWSARPASICRARVDSLVPVDRVEAARVQGEVVPGRDDLGVDRPGRRLRHAARAGDDDGDGRQRRHAGHAASGRARSTRRRQGLAAVPPPRAAVAVSTSRPSTCRPCATGSGWSSTSAGTGGRREHRGPRRLGQDRHGAGHLAIRTRRRPPRGGMDIRDHGWFVFFAPRDNPQIAGVIFAEHGEHGSSAAPIAKSRDGDVLREAGRPAAAGAAARKAVADAGRRRRSASANRRNPPATGAQRPGEPAGRQTRTRGAPPMIVERRLSAHIDWPLVGGRRRARADRARDDLLRHLGFPRRPARRRSSGRRSTRCPIALVAMLAVPDDRLPHARRSSRSSSTPAVRRWRSCRRAVRRRARRAPAAGSISAGSRCSRPSSRRIAIALVLAMFYGESRRSARTTVGDLVARRRHSRRCRSC